MIEQFKDKPWMKFAADKNGLTVHVHGDPASLAMLLGIAMTRVPNLKQLFKTAVESVEEMPDLYKAIDKTMSENQHFN